MAGPESTELVTLLAEPPPGLLVTPAEGDETGLVVRRRRGWVLPAVLGAGVVAGAALSLSWVSAVITMIGVPLLVSGWFSGPGVTLAADRVDGVRYRDIELCEVVGTVNAAVRVICKRGTKPRSRTVFTGSHANAEWLAKVIRRARDGGGVPVLPRMRVRT